MTEWIRGFSDVPIDGTEIEVFHRTAQFAHIVFAPGAADLDMIEEDYADNGQLAWRHADTLRLLDWSPEGIVGWRIATAPPFAKLPYPTRREEHPMRGIGDVSRLYLSDGSYIHCLAREVATVARQEEALKLRRRLIYSDLRRLGTHVPFVAASRTAEQMDNI